MSDPDLLTAAREASALFSAFVFEWDEDLIPGYTEIQEAAQRLADAVRAEELKGSPAA